MGKFELFPNEQIVGVFRGFSEGGLEFHADLVLPYRNDFQSIPMHGQFLIVRLESEREGVLGRVTSLSSAGKLSSGVGEEFNIRAVKDNRPIPEDLREQYLKYQIDIRVLGVVRKDDDDNLLFVASHRRLPHVGSPVAFLSGEILRELVGHNNIGAEVGHFSLGEFVYAKDSKLIQLEDWMQLREPEVLIKFPISNLVSRRTFIFARAGFGKSNLNKLLFSKLYENTPTVSKRNGEIPVGTIVFDPDGEYFWPDDKGRPGLCDVPNLEDKLVVFTNRKGPSEFYQSFVAGGIRLDIRRLKPSDIISIAISPDKQDQQNIRKLRGLGPTAWTNLVNLVDEKGYLSPDDEIADLVGLKHDEEAQINAARANMVFVVRSLHDKSSQLMDRLVKALSDGKLCIIDVSQMRGNQALILTGLILRRIFEKNQTEFTEADPKTIPTIAVIEEAQSVLTDKNIAAEPYIEWVKEGRKYDLGAVLITQQPGSIPVEILSQGDNWFIFHLLSSSDLASVHKANAHFSDDILSSLLNEPIPGQGIFWSSANKKPYPVSLRVLSFEQMYRRLDPSYSRPAANTYALALDMGFAADMAKKVHVTTQDFDDLNESVTVGVVDNLDSLHNRAIDIVKGDSNVMKNLREDGVAWGTLKRVIAKGLPDNMDDKEGFAYNSVKVVLDKIFGPNQWESFKHPKTQATWVKEKK